MSEMRLERTSAPAARIISLADAKAHMRIDHSADNDLIEAMILAIEARLDGVEGQLGRALITQTWKLYLSRFPCAPDLYHRDYRIRLPLPPLQTIESIVYTDTDGAEQTLSSSLYTVINQGVETGAVVPAWGQTWPSTRAVPGAVVVTFKAGYGDAASDIPANIVQAAKLMLTDLYENRGSTTAGFELKPNLAVDALVLASKAAWL